MATCSDRLACDYFEPLARLIQIHILTLATMCLLHSKLPGGLQQSTPLVAGVKAGSHQGRLYTVLYESLQIEYKCFLVQAAKHSHIYTKGVMYLILSEFLSGNFWEKFIALNGLFTTQYDV